ncbi:MAG: hypothetical protein SFY66_10815 [Oculatellaceae cyanobacterium bins.114]|nr:hypothetical protein [Oculatellaceae cyanobacterium bins.114]
MPEQLQQIKQINAEIESLRSEIGENLAAAKNAEEELASIQTRMHEHRSAASLADGRLANLQEELYRLQAEQELGEKCLKLREMADSANVLSGQLYTVLNGFMQLADELQGTITLDHQFLIERVPVIQHRIGSNSFRLGTRQDAMKTRSNSLDKTWDWDRILPDGAIEQVSARVEPSLWS